MGAALLGRRHASIASFRTRDTPERGITDWARGRIDRRGSGRGTGQRLWPGADGSQSAAHRDRSYRRTVCTERPLGRDTGVRTGISVRIPFTRYPWELESPPFSPVHSSAQTHPRSSPDSSTKFAGHRLKFCVPLLIPHASASASDPCSEFSCRSECLALTHSNQLAAALR